MVVGGFARLRNRNSEAHWEDAFSFSPDVFFFLLPPIIFESGYSVQNVIIFSYQTPTIPHIHYIDFDLSR